MSGARRCLPSHCTGGGRTHGKEQERAREVDGATHEEGRQLTERGESGANLFPRNNDKPKHANILFHRHAVMAFPITPWPGVRLQELRNTPDKDCEKLSHHSMKNDFENSIKNLKRDLAVHGLTCFPCDAS